MKLIKEIKDNKTQNKLTLKTREASRAILFDENNLVPLLFVSKYNYHKLPGGGIENQEDKIEALSREAMEEVGCKIEITGEVGKIIEYRTKWNLKQVSFCYHGKITSKGIPSFTEKEKAEGFKITWLTFEKAVNIIQNDLPENYEGSFIQQRDLAFLLECKKILA